MLITSIAVVVLILILAIASSVQIFTNTASAGPKQLQQQLKTLASNTNNTIGNDSILLSPSSTMNIRPNILTDFNPNTTYPIISKFAYVDPLALVIGD